MKVRKTEKHIATRNGELYSYEKRKCIWLRKREKYIAAKKERNEYEQLKFYGDKKAAKCIKTNISWCDVVVLTINQ